MAETPTGVRQNQRALGEAPPWSGYKQDPGYHEDEFPQVGSGALGGWSYLVSGGFLEVKSRHEREVQDELKEETKRRRTGRLRDPR